MTDNPLLQQWNTPFEIPPFDQIKDEHFGPAFEEAFVQARAAVDAITGGGDAPTFANTIEAMEQAEEMLERVAGVFFNLAGADTNDALEALQRDLAPKFAAFSAETLMNEALFARVSAVCVAGLNAEQARVLELYNRMFVRAGAALAPDARVRLKAIMERLASLGTTFSQNVLADEKSWEMALGEGDLAGLPDSLVSEIGRAHG